MDPNNLYKYIKDYKKIFKKRKINKYYYLFEKCCIVADYKHQFVYICPNHHDSAVLANF